MKRNAVKSCTCDYCGRSFKSSVFHWICPECIGKLERRFLRTAFVAHKHGKGETEIIRMIKRQAEKYVSPEERQAEIEYWEKREQQDFEDCLKW